MRWRVRSSTITNSKNALTSWRALLARNSSIAAIWRALSGSSRRIALPSRIGETRVSPIGFVAWLTPARVPRDSSPGHRQMLRRNEWPVGHVKVRKRHRLRGARRQRLGFGRHIEHLHLDAHAHRGAYREHLHEVARQVLDVANEQIARSLAQVSVVLLALVHDAERLQDTFLRATQVELPAHRFLRSSKLATLVSLMPPGGRGRCARMLTRPSPQSTSTVTRTMTPSGGKLTVLTARCPR